MSIVQQTPLPAHPVQSPAQAWTIGYRQPGARALVDTLVLQEDWMLVDLRQSAGSVFLEWTGKACRDRYEDRYLHLPDLGNLNHHRPDLPIQIVNLEAGLSRLTSILARSRRCLLLCGCPDVQHCHRRIIAEQLEARGITVRHFMSSQPSPLIRSRSPGCPRPPRSPMGPCSPCCISPSGSGGSLANTPSARSNWCARSRSVPISPSPCTCRLLPGPRSQERSLRQRCRGHRRPLPRRR